MKRGVVVLLAAVSFPAAGGGAAQEPGSIVFASDRTSALIPDEARLVDVQTGRSRRMGVMRLADVHSHAWSPSGRVLASITDEGDLYISRPGGRARRIVRGRAHNMPSWSPSGRRIAFFGVERRTLSVFVVSSSGRGLHRLAARVAPHADYGAGQRLSWSPDGRRLVLVLRGRLVLLRVTGGRIRRLVTGRGHPRDPAWSPDGRRIAFSAQVPGERATVRIVNLATGARRRVWIGSGIPLWSPDGRKLAIHEKHRLVVLGTGVVATHSPLPAPPVWSPDSHKLAFATNRDVVVASALLRKTRRLTRELATFSLRIEPGWSRSGQLVYVGRRRDPGDLDLHVIQPDGSGARALTKNSVHERDPSWSPDGAHIAFSRARGSNASDIHVIRADGRGERRVAADGRTPSWSHDGSRLAFERNGDIWIVRSDGSGATPVTAGPERDSAPDWSPRGDEIAFARDPDRGTSEIYAIDLSSGTLRRITSESHHNVGCFFHNAWAPAWTPHGERLAYEVESGGSEHCSPTRGHHVAVYTIARDGSSRELVTDGGYWDVLADDGALTPTWSSDGMRIAFVSAVSQQEPEYEQWWRIGVVSASGGAFRLITPKAYRAHDPDWRP